MADARKHAPEMAQWLRHEALDAIELIGDESLDAEKRAQVLQHIADRTAGAAEMLDALMVALERHVPVGAEDRLIVGMNTLISAVAALGFERARDGVTSYGDEADQDAADWHDVFVDMIEVAVTTAARAAHGDRDDYRWVTVSPAIRQSFTWEWHGDVTDDDEFADLVLGSVARALGRDDARPGARHDAQGDADTYLVWSHEHGVWWRPDGFGYTPTVAEAGRFDRDRALRIYRDALSGVRKGNPFNEVPVRLADVEAFTANETSQDRKRD